MIVCLCGQALSPQGRLRSKNATFLQGTLV